MGKHTEKYTFNITYLCYDARAGKEIKYSCMFVNSSMLGALAVANKRLGEDKILAISYLNPEKAKALGKTKPFVEGKEVFESKSLFL